MGDSGPNIKDLYKFFGNRPGKTLKDFAAELKELTDEDRNQLGSGIADGSLTY